MKLSFRRGKNANLRKLSFRRGKKWNLVWVVQFCVQSTWFPSTSKWNLVLDVEKNET